MLGRTVKFHKVWTKIYIVSTPPNANKESCALIEERVSPAHVGGLGERCFET